MALVQGLTFKSVLAVTMMLMYFSCERKSFDPAKVNSAEKKMTLAAAQSSAAAEPSEDNNKMGSFE